MNFMSVKLCFLILGASSSMLEDRNKILEKILDDLHRGNFHPIIKSEVHTPEMMELDHFEFSNISFVESPSTQLTGGIYISEEDILSPTDLTIKLKPSSGRFYNPPNENLNLLVRIKFFNLFNLIFWCLEPLSAVFQLYHGDEFIYIQ